MAMHSSLINCNDNLLCAVDVETTGDRAGFHDLIQLCVLPLTADLKPNGSIVPFYCELKPIRPENHYHESTKVNRGKLCEAMINGLDPDRAADLFDEWFQKLQLPWGKRIMPLAHNWCHDRAFLIEWLGWTGFHSHFDIRYRDVMTVALYSNDLSEFQSERHPYPKVSLQYLCTHLRIQRDRSHDSMQDCVVTAQVYRQLIMKLCGFSPKQTNDIQSTIEHRDKSASTTDPDL